MAQCARQAEGGGGWRKGQQPGRARAEHGAPWRVCVQRTSGLLAGQRLEGCAQGPPETALAFVLCCPVRFYHSPFICGPRAALCGTGLLQNEQWEAQCPDTAPGWPRRGDLCEQTPGLPREAASTGRWPGRDKALWLQRQGQRMAPPAEGKARERCLGRLLRSPRVVAPPTDDGHVWDLSPQQGTSSLDLSYHHPRFCKGEKEEEEDEETRSTGGGWQGCCHASGGKRRGRAICKVSLWVLAQAAPGTRPPGHGFTLSLLLLSLVPLALICS